MPEQPCPEFDIDLAARVRKHPGADAAQQRLEQIGADQADRDHVERLHRVIDEHLVHHDLEEHGRDQANQLQDKRDQQDFAKQAAVLDDRGNEPTEVEFRQIADEVGLAGDEHQFPTPIRQEGLDREHRRWFAGALDQDLRWAIAPGIQACRNEGASVVVEGNRGQRSVRQPVARLAHEFGRQPEPLAGQQQSLRLEGLRPEFMTQLHLIGCNAMKARHHQQRLQLGIPGGGRCLSSDLLFNVCHGWIRAVRLGLRQSE